MVHPAPRITTWVQTYQIAKELVCAGEGLALVDPFTAVSAGPDVQIRTVVPNFPVRLYAAYRIDGPLNSVQKTFLQCVEGVSRELIDALQGVGTEAA